MRIEAFGYSGKALELKSIKIRPFFDYKSRTYRRKCKGCGF